MKIALIVFIFMFFKILRFFLQLIAKNGVYFLINPQRWVKFQFFKCIWIF